MTGRRWFATTFVALGLALGLFVRGAAAQKRPAASWSGIDPYVEQALRDWKVPGVAIAIVKNDSVVYARGYGVKTLGKPDPVTANTIFAIGSSSKAFTATLMGMLVDDGKVRWDDPVSKLLPGFQLNDPYVTREITIRDILSHRSGLARGDFIWYASPYSRDEVVRRVRYLQPSWSFRSHFGYQNIMFITAGTVEEHVTGMSWDQLVKTRLFTPLGMTATTTSIKALSSMPDVASPHAELDDTVRVIPWRNIDNAGPAGSINSSVTDMARWVRFQLDSGVAGGKRLVSAAALVETHTPQTIIPVTTQARSLNPYRHFSSYGFGWFLQDYRGKEVVQHGGNIDGMSALVAMMPEERLGMVILTNMNATPLPSVLMNRIFDMALGAPPKDWSGDFHKVVLGLDSVAKATEKKKEAARVAGTRPSLPLAGYAGTYVDSMYGEVKVAANGSALVLSLPSGISADLEHWHYDTFRGTWRDRTLGKALMTFVLDERGKVKSLDFEPGDDQAEEVPRFRRQEEKADTVAKVTIAAADLPRYAGTFESKSPPLTAQVEIVEGVLKLTVAGQPPYTLVAESVTRFRLTGPPGMPAGFFLDYLMDRGAVKSVTLVQPDPRPSLTMSPKAENR